MAHALSNLFNIEDPKPITTPGLTRQKPPSIRTSPSDRELDDLIFGPPTNPSATPKHDAARSPTTTSGAQTPLTPGDLEGASRPPSPTEPTPIVQTIWSPPMNRWRVLCACLVYFGNGLNDAAPGALIPYMETHYAIGYAVVSLIFVANAAGFIAAAFVTDALRARLGRARALMLSEAVMAAGYVVIVCTPPFGAVVAAFFLLGFGCAINLALNNVFCANLHGSTVILGMAHGSYGIGGTVGPVAATALASGGVVWSRFYFVTLGIRAACVAFTAWAWWNVEKEEREAAALLTELERTASRRAAPAAAVEGDGAQVEVRQPSKRGSLKQAVRNKVTLIGALFIFMYQGAEVTIAGWVISFLINYRGGEPGQVGYVTAGFFGGITLGRFALTPFCHRFGESNAVYVLTTGVLIFDILVWQIPNLISNTIFVCIVGLLLGPVYPCAQTIFSRMLPRKIQTTCVGFIASAGSSGGAVMPFLTGLLAQVTGTWVLHPVCVASFVGMVGCWLALPKMGKKKE